MRGGDDRASRRAASPSGLDATSSTRRQLGSHSDADARAEARRSTRGLIAEACGVTLPLQPRLELAHRVERDELEVLGRELLASARLAVDDADDRAELGAAGAQLRRGVEDRAARGDDVLDDAQAPAVDLGALGELAGAVGLGLLADEDGRAAP